LLLRAALLAGPEAQAALAAWKQACGYKRYDEIDFEATQFLPSAYLNLVRAGLCDAWFPQLAGLLRYQWLHDVLQQQQFAIVLGHLTRKGIEPLVTGSLALLAGGYIPTSVPRSLPSAELLIAPSEAPAIHAILAEQGWTNVAAVPPTIPGWRSESWRGGHRWSLELHYSLLPRPYPVVGHAEIWRHAQTAEICGAAVRIPPAEDLLMQLCVRGHQISHARSSPAWMADVFRMVEVAHDRLDWDRLQATANARGALRPLGETLSYLAQQFSAPVPASWLNAAAGEHRRPENSWGPLFSLGNKLWGGYACAEEAAGRSASALGGMQYLAWKLGQALRRRRGTRTAG
jgi:hypothetical protein